MDFKMKIQGTPRKWYGCPMSMNSYGN